MKRPKVGDILGWVRGVDHDHYGSLYDRWDKDACLVYKTWEEAGSEGVWVMWVDKQDGRKVTQQVSYRELEAEYDFAYSAFFPIDQIMETKND